MLLQWRSTPSTGHGFESPVFTKALHPPDRRTDADIKLFSRLPSGSSFLHEVDDARSQLTRIRSMHWPALRRINALELAPPACLGNPNSLRSGRAVIMLLGGAAAAWPLVARAQQAERVRKVGVLINSTATPEQRANLAAFQQTLQQLGWTVGRNVQMDIRYAEGDPRETRKHAGELVALAPDVIVTAGDAGMTPLLQATRTIPIVFNSVADPVGAGFVKSMARPGGNATGFIQYEYSLSAKWLETLKEIEPRLTRVAVLRDATLASGIGQFAVIQSVAPSLRVETSAIDVRDAGEIESDIADLARTGHGGLILTGSALALVHRDAIIALAARHKLPAIFYRRAFVDAGGLISYGYDVLDQYRRSAGYVDRILKGAKPADLPVLQFQPNSSSSSTSRQRRLLGLSSRTTYYRSLRRGIE